MIPRGRSWQCCTKVIDLRVGTRRRGTGPRADAWWSGALPGRTGQGGYWAPPGVIHLASRFRGSAGRARRRPGHDGRKSQASHKPAVVGFRPYGPRGTFRWQSPCWRGQRRPWRRWRARWPSGARGPLEAGRRAWCFPRRAPEPRPFLLGGGSGPDIAGAPETGGKLTLGLGCIQERAHAFEVSGDLAEALCVSGYQRGGDLALVATSSPSTSAARAASRPATSPAQPSRARP